MGKTGERRKTVDLSNVISAALNSNRMFLSVKTIYQSLTVIALKINQDDFRNHYLLKSVYRLKGPLHYLSRLLIRKTELAPVCFH